jgi:dihydrofolate reductase/thymidylate synthase
MFNIVVALDSQRGIGREGRLPWRLSGDMRFFRELTTSPDRAAVEQRYFGPRSLRASPTAPAPFEQWLRHIKSKPPLPLPDPNRRNAVLMGRKTWDSLPPAFKPLPNRLNGVLSREGTQGGSGTHRVFGDLGAALEELRRDESVSEIFVIGGAQIYAEALQSPECARIYATGIDSAFTCDAFFPEIPAAFREAAAAAPVLEEDIRYRFRLLERTA